jgi:hypothetical protein
VPSEVLKHRTRDLIAFRFATVMADGEGFFAPKILTSDDCNGVTFTSLRKTLPFTQEARRNEANMTRLAKQAHRI